MGHVLVRMGPGIKECPCRSDAQRMQRVRDHPVWLRFLGQRDKAMKTGAAYYFLPQQETV
ncbi:hypothetical protein SAMN05720354_101244 [Nitrosospira sp. Nsp1]|nr:hypothetical protein SAMN05720354_101244 [Nitrosospira sp. Nsp1]